MRIISCQHGNSCKFEIDKNIKLYSLNGEKCENSALRKIYVEKQLIKYVKEEQIDVMIAVDVALYLYLIPLQIKKICNCSEPGKISKSRYKMLAFLKLFLKFYLADTPHRRNA